MKDEEKEQNGREERESSAWSKEEKVRGVISIFGDSVPGSMIGITLIHKVWMVVASRH